MTDALDELRDAAAAAARQAYAPYSGLRVGAALRSTSGRTYVGCNVENGALPIGSCAERAAISAAVTAEGPAFGFAAIAVVGTGRSGEPLHVTPCGACRQALVEFGDTARVAFLAPSGWTVVSAGDLLPYRFVLPATR